MTNIERIAQYYDENAQEEYLRLEKSPLQQSEFILTTDLLDEYIPQNSIVLDIGAGPGRYSEYLITHSNCKLGLVDLSEKSLENFRERLSNEYQNKVIFTQKASVTNLKFVADESFEHVLLMGPLYHLQTEPERKQAIKEARRVLRTGGYIFTSFISPYHVIPRFLGEAFSLIGNRELINDVINEGLIESKLVSGFIDHFRYWPDQAKVMMENAGFQTIRMRNMEGVGTFFREKQAEVLTSKEKLEAWFYILRITCENKDLLGATIHFLYVGRK